MDRKVSADNATRKTVRIGGASGFWGDSITGPIQLAERAEVDYIEDYDRIQAFLRNSAARPLAEPEPIAPALQEREARIAVAV